MAGFHSAPDNAANITPLQPRRIKRELYPTDADLGRLCRTCSSTNDHLQVDALEDSNSIWIDEMADRKRPRERMEQWMLNKRSRPSSTSAVQKSSISLKLTRPQRTRISDAISDNQASPTSIDVSQRVPNIIPGNSAPLARANDIDNPTTDHQQYSNATQDLWEMARQQLDKEEQGVLETNVEIGPTKDILDQVQEVIKDKKRQVEEKAWKLEFRGRVFVFRDVIEKIAGWIKIFRDIGDTVIQIDPVHSALPWAAIKLVLMVRA